MVVGRGEVVVVVFVFGGFVDLLGVFEGVVGFVFYFEGV